MLRQNASNVQPIGQLNSSYFLLSAIALAATTFTTGFGLTRHFIAHQAIAANTTIPGKQLAQQLTPTIWKNTNLQLTVANNRLLVATPPFASSEKAHRWGDRFATTEAANFSF
ncbi:hypothetical protein [Almyronema epifaneia]|uniref:Uncharacterized protein n=1 Tax=Almyronema epifaneia S1 TaxID=2991925 RepID=A0ABW6IAG3_9CYAN